ncbi:MAG: hypothetical protein ACOH1Q_07740 [Thiobacillus sp.]
MRLQVDIRELIRSINMNLGGGVLYRWLSNQPDAPAATLFTRTSPELITVRHVGGSIPDETLDVAYTACRYGGRRAWFICGKLGCGRRVAVLYNAVKGFSCRHCQHLGYLCQREQPYDRLLRRARRVRDKVGGVVNLIAPLPPKPKWMHWTTYEGVLERENQLWGQVADAAERRKPLLALGRAR